VSRIAAALGLAKMVNVITIRNLPHKRLVDEAVDVDASLHAVVSDHRLAVLVGSTTPQPAPVGLRINTLADPRLT